MLNSLSFGAPLVLFGLLALPVLWRLLRVMPPSPERKRFFALRLLDGLFSRSETPAQTPWWLLAMRLTIVAALVFAFAEPQINAPKTEAAEVSGVVIAVDNSWAAAARWDQRRTRMAALISEAKRANLPVLLLPTAGRASAAFSDPADAEARAAALEPEPFAPDRGEALRALSEAAAGRRLAIYWLSDGVATEDSDSFAQRLAALGRLTVDIDPPEHSPLALTRLSGSAAAIRILRPHGGPERSLALSATGERGRIISVTPLTLAAGQTVADVTLDLPSEVTGDVARIAIDTEASAGAVSLFLAGAQRPVGIAVNAGQDAAQPLLAGSYYVERAFEGAAQIRKASVQALIDAGAGVIVLTDTGQLPAEELALLTRWVESGGVLIRFAGPRLAAQADALLPVRLRPGGARALGGAMSWEQPQGLGPFPEASPFAGFEIPADVSVRRQVLAEPSVDLESRTFAALADGTPLVTAARQAQGWLVLFHVTANPDWSNLPMSGLFVSMLRKLAELSRLGAAEADATEASGQNALALRLALDAYGRLGQPPEGSEALSSGLVQSQAGHPPGFYGDPQSGAVLNTLPDGAALTPITAWPEGAVLRGYDEDQRTDLKPVLLVLAFLLALADAAAAFVLRGLRLPGLRTAPRAAASLVLLAAMILSMPAMPARAQTAEDAAAIEAVRNTRLAYVVTGDVERDRMTEDGLKGLTRILRMRTAVVPAAPVGVNVARDELAFYPLLYWALPPEGQGVSDQAIERIDAYLKNGGTIIFDTADGRDGGPASEALTTLLRRLDLPPLERVPPDHVLTKAFYLLAQFPGRRGVADVWVEAAASGDDAASEARGDGVSTLIIGSADWAGAWAADDYGRPLYAMDEGGERRRELAYRFGVNLVMYALTGNYKADQVHVPALLERLGQ